MKTEKKYTAFFKCRQCGKEIKRTYPKERTWAVSFCEKTGKQARMYRVN